MPHLNLKWTPDALADVQWLYHFLAPKSPDAARRAIQTIRAGVKILAHQSNSGRPAEDLDPKFRDWLIDFGDSGYVPRYFIDGNTVIVLAIRHQKEAGF